MSEEPRKIYSVADLVRETGIPRKSVTEILANYSAAIPSLMDGDRRRYPQEAVQALLRVWREYQRGIKEVRLESTWFTETLEKILTSSEQLAEAAGTLRKVQSDLRSHPPHRIFHINAFPGGDLQPVRAIAVHVDTQKARSRATLMEAGLEAYGENDKAAVMNLREVIMRTFLRMERERNEEEAEQFTLLSSLIRRRKV